MQQAREAARRTQCRGNLKQIGLALHNYHDLHNLFPPGWVYDPARSAANYVNNCWGWGTSILPLLDQASVYNTCNFNRGFPGGLNASGVEV